MRETDQSIPDRLPLLDALLAERVGGTTPLKGVRAVLIQHQLGSQVPMTRALIQLGVEPQHVHWVDVPDTANATARAALLGLGARPQHFVGSGSRLYMPYSLDGASLVDIAGGRTG